MSKQLITIASVLAIAMTSSASWGATEKEGLQASLEKVAPYPAARKDQTRYSIFLPQKDNEDDYKVEINMGKTIKVDCNHHSFGGELREETLQGWGYTYFVLDKVMGHVSTKMACPGQKEQDAFVEVYPATRLVRYNSKLPLVIYVPKDIQVRYRLWQAEKEYQPAQRQ
ncbi:MAG: serine protease inhibitor ecotin [Enterobacteriaceae bacterium]